MRPLSFSEKETSKKEFQLEEQVYANGQGWAVRKKVMKKIGEQQEEKISEIRIRKRYEQTHRIV